MRTNKTRYRALIEYDGTDYFGFQRQIESQPTIQSEIEQALTDLTRFSVTLTGSGRTDRGVHATGQVISFDIDWRHGSKALQRVLNANLPKDIVFLQIKEAPPTFHPRFDAKRREYAYRIIVDPVRRPLQRRSVWQIARMLDVERMNLAASSLIGDHDFSTFGTPPQGSNSVRELFTAFWQKVDNQLIFRVEANAFLYRMVRSLVGCLVAVGNGFWSVEDFVAALQACDRSRAAPVAPPQGLCLVAVTYDE